MKRVLVTLSLLGVPAFGEPFMACTHTTNVNSTVSITIDLLDMRDDDDGSSNRELKAKVTAVNSQGKKLVYAGSWGWLKETGEFMINFCTKKRCDMILDGKIMKSGKVKGAELTAVRDNFDAQRGMTSCHML